jgi:hypothetical protein
MLKKYSVNELNIFLPLLVSVLFIFSANAKPLSLCELNSNKAQQIIKINDIPSYFFKVHPSGKYISYIGSKGNQLVHMDTGRTIPLPGTIDPVFTSDGNYLIVPMFKDEHKGPLTPGDQVLLHDGSNLEMQTTRFTIFPSHLFINRINNSKSKTFNVEEFDSHIMYDAKNNGVYQSVAKVGEGIYRSITDKNGVSLRHYNIKDDEAQSIDALEKPCQNIDDFPTDLPIISKDGRFISVNNTKTKSTQIYQFGEDGSCSLSLDLGIPTGKVSFNKDSTKIVFHMDHFNESMGGYFSGTATDVIRDVYTVNLNHKKDNKNQISLVPTTWAKVTNSEQLGNGSYYPDFSDNDDIFYLSDVNNYFQFSRTSPHLLSYQPFNKLYELIEINKKDSSCPKPSPEILHQFILGKIWSQTCLKLNDPKILDSALLSLSIPQKQCEELIQKEWNETLEKKVLEQYGKKFDLQALFSITKEDLIAACPKNASAKNKVSVIGKWNERNAIQYKEVVKQKCLSCHSQPVEYKKEIPAVTYYDEDGKYLDTKTIFVNRIMPPINLEKIDIKVANKLKAAVSEKDPKKRMPKGGSLKASEIQLFFDHVQELELSSKLNEEKFDYDMPLTGYRYSDKKIQSLISDYKAHASNLSAKERDKFVKAYTEEVYCKFQQKNCAQVIQSTTANKLKEWKAKNPKATAEELTSQKAEIELTLKCDFTFEVSSLDCNPKR